MKIRSSQISGTWYPENPHELRETVDGSLSEAGPSMLSQPPAGLIVPHAGYQYSGRTAAYGYNTLKKEDVDTIVIISPLHRPPSPDIFIPEADAYETPLGRIEIEKTVLEKLQKKTEMSSIKNDGEHAIEIHLPFY